MIASERTFAPAPAGHPRAHDCSVWLYSCGAFDYGSLARGVWDGFSDTDLLVVNANQDEAERAADQLMEALVGDDVLAIDQERWQAMAISPLPHWPAIRLYSKSSAGGAQGVPGGGTESMGRHRYPFRRVQPLPCQVITGIPSCFG